MSAVYFKRISQEEKAAFRFSWLNFFVAIERAFGIALMGFFVWCGWAGYELKKDVIRRDIILAELELKKYSHCDLKKSRKHKRG